MDDDAAGAVAEGAAETTVERCDAAAGTLEAANEGPCGTAAGTRAGTQEGPWGAAVDTREDADEGRRGTGEWQAAQLRCNRPWPEGESARRQAQGADFRLP